jgi:hypothetical protein
VELQYCMIIYFVYSSFIDVVSFSQIVRFHMKAWDSDSQFSERVVDTCPFDLLSLLAPSPELSLLPANPCSGQPFSGTMRI